MQSAAQLTAYELQRLSNVQRNREALAALGIEANRTEAVEQLAQLSHRVRRAATADPRIGSVTAVDE